MRSFTAGNPTKTGSTNHSLVEAWTKAYNSGTQAIKRDRKRERKRREKIKFETDLPPSIRKEEKKIKEKLGSRINLSHILVRSLSILVVKI
jgi:hypothetical protein